MKKTNEEKDCLEIFLWDSEKNNSTLFYGLYKFSEIEINL